MGSVKPPRAQRRTRLRSAFRGSAAACWTVLLAWAPQAGAQPVDDGLDGIRALLPAAADGPTLERAWRAFQEASPCSKRRKLTAAVESNQIFDSTWDADSGEIHEAVRKVLKSDPGAYFFMVNRAFTSGNAYVETEGAYLECLAEQFGREGFRRYDRILKDEGLTDVGLAAHKALLVTLLLAIGIQDGKLIVSQHLNELTVQRMLRSIEEYLTGDKRREALELVAGYGRRLPALEAAVAKMGAFINADPESPAGQGRGADL